MSDLAILYEKSQQSAVFFDLSQRSLLRISGPERISFLNGILSPDLNALAVGGYTSGALLEPKGKYLYNLHIWITQDAVLIDTDPGQGTSLTKQLQAYKFRAKVDFEELTGRCQIICMAGPESENILKSASVPVPENSIHTAERDVVVRIHNPQPDSFYIYTEDRSLKDRLEQAGAASAGKEIFEVLRIISGEPSWDAELTRDVIPMEALQHRALSFTKCYPGQEVVSRIHYRGHVNRVLQRFVMNSTGIIQPGFALMDQDKQVGALTSVVAHPVEANQWMGLGYIRRELALEGKNPLVAVKGGCVEARILPLPYQAVV